MPFSSLISAVMESSLNRLLTLDPNYKLAIKPLIGKVLSIEITGLLPQRFFCFSSGEMTILENMGEEADCALKLTPSALPKLRDSSQFSDLIKNDELSIVGDIKLAHQFSELLTQLNIDIEELLSHKIGDPLAHTLVYAGKQVTGLLKAKAQQLTSDLTEVAKHEWRTGPSQFDIEAWSLEIDQLAEDLDQLERRTAALSVTKVATKVATKGR